MYTLKRTLWLTFLFLYTALPHTYALQTPSDETVLVGHISHVEGELLRYVPDDEDWVATVEDAPCGIDDVLYTGNHAKAELIMPNNTWIRIGDNTQIHIIQLESDLTVVDIDSGIARLYNKSATATIKATTPLGSITAPPSSICDLYLEDDSIQVSALEGSVDFLHVTDSKHYGVTAGSSSLRAGYQEVASLNEIVDTGWDSWNAERDNLWEKRFAAQDDSPDYLPEELQYESYALEENGTWENVYYEGSNRYFWRPRYLSPHWSPFTVGRWTVWYGDHCWVPYEPFGYITHHYGNWVYIDSCSRWYWAPPRCHRGISGGSYLDIGFGWYPGRVSWIHRGGYVGWIPLAPFERYYSRNYWGPRSHVIHRGGLGIVSFDTKHCRYNKHAIVVRKHNFYNRTDYNPVRIRGLHGNVIDNYQRTHFINSRVIKRFKKMPQRFTFGTGKVKRKPPLTVTERVQRKKFINKPVLERKRGKSRKSRAKISPAKDLKRPSRKAPRAPRRTFAVKKSAQRKTIRNSKHTTRKPRLNLQKRQTRSLSKVRKVTKRNPRRTTLKPRTLPQRKKSRSLARNTSKTKRSRGFSGLQQQRSVRRPRVKAQRLKARPRLRARNL
jgi:hypothetical protein